MRINRRRVFKLMGLVSASLFVQPGFQAEPIAIPSVNSRAGDAGAPCTVRRDGAQVELHSPAFVFRLDTSRGLRAIAWSNRRTGRQISLGGGPELEVELDRAEQRIGMAGWRVGPAQAEEKAEQPEFDDSSWQQVAAPQSPGWARTRVLLPANAASQPLALTVGGFGLFDFRQLQVFVNGHKIGERRNAKRWTEPLVLDLGPQTSAHGYLRFGEGANVIALLLDDYVSRTARLDELDTTRTRAFPKDQWPAQFEQYLTIGEAPQVPLGRVSDVIVAKEGDAGELYFDLATETGPIAARVTYQWNSRDPVLRKTATIRNRSDALVRLLGVRLADYPTDARVSEGEQGFPVYLDGQFYAGLAHPSGWAIGQEGRLLLRQYPGRRLAPGATFESMEAVLGVSAAGQARPAFLAHVQERSRRVQRRQDKPYAIYETFGSRPGGDFSETEGHVLEMIGKVAKGQREEGCHFDICSLEFWVDYRGDLKRCDPERFPHGLTRLNAELQKMKTSLGLWIDSSMQSWSIGGNPAMKPSLNHSGSFFCRAAEPIRTAYREAFLWHLRENGARLFKFDNLCSLCYRAEHDHLPGIYSTEAIQSSVIEFLHALDQECPDVFLMLYWGYRSPWWLLHANTLFEPGLAIEAASPGPSPALYGRDSVTVGLDQAQWWCQDVPPLGKDSLGVWLSDWPWNSSVGKERWPEGLIMDLCRGSLLAQIWSDTPWLSPPERQQLAEFIDLLKARPNCFAHPRFVLGNPWRQEPYGYCCTDGSRAFLALNNCTWSDHPVQLQLNSAWGLADTNKWDLYRWHPSPARLTGDTESLAETVSLVLRPFEVTLLEAVPSGQAPSLGRRFRTEPIPAGLREASRTLPLLVQPVADDATTTRPPLWTVLQPLEARSDHGTMLQLQPDLSVLAKGLNPSPETYTISAQTDLTGITAFRLEVLPDPSLPANGPGRAFNGNFSLSELRVTAAPLTNQSLARSVPLRDALADYSQESHGGWPVTAAIDGNPATGWSIDPAEGESHAASFQTTEPIGFAGGTTLTFILVQQPPKDHNLGRLRLSASTAQPPVAPDVASLPKRMVRGEMPATEAGGLVVVTVEMHRGAAPYMVGDAAGKFVVPLQSREGAPAWEPVVHGPGYPVSWQGWRRRVAASARPQPFALEIGARSPLDVELTFRGHFIPAQPNSSPDRALP